MKGKHQPNFTAYCRLVNNSFTLTQNQNTAVKYLKIHSFFYIILIGCQLKNQRGCFQTAYNMKGKHQPNFTAHCRLVNNSFTLTQNQNAAGKYIKIHSFFLSNFDWLTANQSERMPSNSL